MEERKKKKVYCYAPSVSSNADRASFLYKQHYRLLTRTRISPWAVF